VPARGQFDLNVVGVGRARRIRDRWALDVQGAGEVLQQSAERGAAGGGFRGPDENGGVSTVVVML